LEVATAEYGLGAFSTQYIKKGDFIGGNASLYNICCIMLNKLLEYLGEIYNTYENTSRPYAADPFMKLTY
jgi:hypothetical protein